MKSITHELTICPDTEWYIIGDYDGDSFIYKTEFDADNVPDIHLEATDEELETMLSLLDSCDKKNFEKYQKEFLDALAGKDSRFKLFACLVGDGALKLCFVEPRNGRYTYADSLEIHIFPSSDQIDSSSEWVDLSFKIIAQTDERDTPDYFDFEIHSNVKYRETVASSIREYRNNKLFSKVTFEDDYDSDKVFFTEYS